jgi:hypothetical protein
MLRNRLFLFGLGTGLIVAALVLQIVNEADKVANGDPQAVQGDMSLEKLRDAAGRWGYDLYKQDETLYTAAELESRIQEALSKEREQAPKKDQAQSPMNEEQFFAFSVGSGSDVSTIAHMLVEMGLIDNWRTFMDEIESRDAAQSVQARYYIFKGKPSLDELVTALTKPE